MIHIGFSQPWYEAHIWNLNYTVVIWNTIPLLGHNRDYAYGLTMFENDDIDFYRERIVLGMGINIKLLQV
jgi:penicillin amidase